MFRGVVPIPFLGKFAVGTHSKLTYRKVSSDANDAVSMLDYWRLDECTQTSQFFDEFLVSIAKQ